MMFIDKASSLLTKMSITVNNQGMDMIVDTYPSDYKEINGVFLATKTTISAMGQEFTQTVTNVEVDIPMDDSIFTLK
jgi:hypothetical protein